MDASDKLQAMLEEFGPNAGLVEELFREYLKSPASVSKSWQHYFGKLIAEPIPMRGNGTDQAAVQLTPLHTQAGTQPLAPPSPLPTHVTALKGVAAKIVENMEASLALPTATSMRTLPVKVLEENRRLLNHYLGVRGSAKISYTHIIAWALVRALQKYPNLNAAFARIEGIPHRTER